MPSHGKESSLLLLCCHRVRDLDLTQVSSAIKHYNDDIMINLAKVQHPAQTVKFLGIIWAKAAWAIPQVIEKKLLSLSTPSTKQEAQCLVGLFGFWRTHITHVEILLVPIYKISQRKLCLGRPGGSGR